MPLPPPINPYAKAPQQKPPPKPPYDERAADSGADSLDDADMDGKNGVSTDDDNDVVMPPSSKRCRPSAADGVACTADPHQDFFNFRLFSYARFCMPCNKLIGGSYQDSQSHMQQAHKPELDRMILHHSSFNKAHKHMESIQSELGRVPFIPKGEEVTRKKCSHCGKDYSKESRRAFRDHITASRGMCDGAVAVPTVFVKTVSGVFVEKPPAPIPYNLMQANRRPMATKRYPMIQSGSTQPFQPSMDPTQQVTPFSHSQSSAVSTMATWNRLTVAAPANQYDNQMKMLENCGCYYCYDMQCQEYSFHPPTECPLQRWLRTLCFVACNQVENVTFQTSRQLLANRQ